jgi:hypothetical protein
VKKIITTKNEHVTIRGNGRWIPIEYKQADWNDGEEVACFKHGDDYVYLDEVVATDPRGIFREYDGIVNFYYGGGLLIKLNASRDAVQVFYFYGYSQLDD